MRILHVLICSFCLIFMAAPAAEARAPICSGVDLLTTLKESEPEVYAEMKARAAAAPNAEGRIWKVLSPDPDAAAMPSLLYGTIHRSDPRVTDLPKPLLNLLYMARVVFVEVVRADMRGFALEVQGDPSLVKAGDGPRFDDGFTDEQKKLARKVLKEYGVSYTQAREMKPALLLTMLNASPCMAMRARMGKKSVDLKIEQIGKNSGAKVKGLETTAEQVAKLTAIEHEDMRDILLAGFASALESRDLHETTLQAYLREEIQLIWEFSLYANAEAGVLEDPDKSMQAFWDVLIASRNRIMADRAAAELEKGDVVMAVGALHLPGEDGLVELLRQKGFTVTRVEL